MLGVSARTSQPEQWGAMMPAAPVPGPLRRQVRITNGSVGGIPGEWTRLTVMSNSGLTMLYLHGGAYVVGSAASERPLIARLTVEVRGQTFAADYRLAPRHPFPAALDDASAAYYGLLQGGVDAGSVIVAGDSAGGGLTMALLVKLRDESAPLPAGAIVFSPWVDLTNNAKSIQTNAATDYLSAIPTGGAPLYLGGTDATHPLVSPLFADLAGLPPLLIFAGGREMLLDDAVHLHQKALDAGVSATLHIEPDMFHVWPVILPRHPASERAFGVAEEWVIALMSGTAASL